MENKLTFFENSMFVDVMDEYMIWRLKDLIEYDIDPKVRKACFVLKAYMEAPESEDEND
jgi:hypothetical protein